MDVYVQYGEVQLVSLTNIISENVGTEPSSAGLRSRQPTAWTVGRNQFFDLHCDSIFHIEVWNLLQHIQWREQGTWWLHVFKLNVLNDNNNNNNNERTAIRGGPMWASCTPHKLCEHRSHKVSTVHTHGSSWKTYRLCWYAVKPKFESTSCVALWGLSAVPIRQPLSWWSKDRKGQQDQIMGLVPNWHKEVNLQSYIVTDVKVRPGETIVIVWSHTLKLSFNQYTQSAANSWM